MVNLGNVFILGDSYSTFENFVPENYYPYYTYSGRKDSDINNVTQTWWYQVINATGSVLLRNCSFSATTICNTGYNGSDCSETSFVSRLDKLIKNNYFKDNRVDTFFIFGGTNDSWAGSPIGELKYSDWKKEDLYNVLPAFCYLIHQIKTNIADVRIINILNTELNEALAEGITAACKNYDIELVKLCGIEKMNDHPDMAGMRQIKQQVLAKINRKRVITDYV